MKFYTPFPNDTYIDPEQVYKEIERNILKLYYENVINSNSYTKITNIVMRDFSQLGSELVSAEKANQWLEHISNELELILFQQKTTKKY